MTTLRRAFLALSIAWAALLPLAPFAASQPAPAPLWYGLAFAVYGAGSFICHQLPARSFHTWAAQWPVCARCTGIYFGAAAAAMVASKYVGSGMSRTVGSVSRTRVLLVLAALPTAVTLIYEWTTGDTPSNTIRALAGAPLGAAVAFVVVEALRIRSAASR
jgi:uncharacterized membrane protein